MIGVVRDDLDGGRIDQRHDIGVCGGGAQRLDHLGRGGSVGVRHGDAGNSPVASLPGVMGGRPFDRWGLYDASRGGSAGECAAR